MRKTDIFLFTPLFVLLVGANSLAAEGWISFQQSSAPSYPHVQTLSSNGNELILQISFPGADVREVAKEGVAYQAVSIPGGGRTYDIGRPELPTWSRFLAVPQGARPEVEIIEYASRTLSGFNVYPAQEQAPDRMDAPQPEFAKDTEFYATNQLYPDRLAFVRQPNIIRGCAVSSLVLFPVQYNPARGELEVVSEMKLRVSFNGGGGTFVHPRYRSAYFEGLFRNLLLNYSVLGSPPTLEAEGDTGCDFLIITHPDFEAWAESLAFWKNATGMPTLVVDTTQTGSDTGSIRTYVQNAYDNWEPPPSFLLLLGDAEFIPVFYRTAHSLHGTETGTDLYYATVDGDDFFPDMFCGRISVDSAGDAEAAVGKILRYQRSPISSPTSFYDQVLIAGHFQDKENYLDGWEDRFFIKTSETIRGFLASEGYTAERCYTKDAQSVPCCYYFGDPLPPGLTWDGSTSQISDAIEEGAFLVNHRDHGAFSGWSHPGFSVSDVNALSNGDALPVVFSVNCQTGWFDNETDEDDPVTTYDAICFCEAFLRHDGGGCVGIFGHTRASWSGMNDELCKGFYDAIWPDFDPSYPCSGSTEPIYAPMYRMGAVFDFGRFWMYDKYHVTGGGGYPEGYQWESDSARTLESFETAHWFGDPTMQIWTAFPQTLDVSHTDTISVGVDSVYATVTSDAVVQESVLVCLMNEEVYEVGYTDASGEVAFSCSTPDEGSLLITATKHNFRPYQGSIEVVGESLIYGDLNGDSSIDVGDVVFLINYLFKGQAVPSPYESGDVTCDGTIDIGDVVWLVNYLYREGPAPGCQ